jgi:hypothetical protein
VEGADLTIETPFPPAAGEALTTEPAVGFAPTEALSVGGDPAAVNIRAMTMHAAANPKMTKL